MNNLPKSQQPKGRTYGAKQRLHEIYMAPAKREAEEAFDFFLEA